MFSQSFQDPNFAFSVAGEGGKPTPEASVYRHRWFKPRSCCARLLLWRIPLSAY